MADGLVQVQPDSTGKKVDTSELTVGANTVERQRIVLSSDSVAAALAAVQNSDPAGTEYALVTRPIASGTQTVTQGEQSTTGTIVANGGTVTLNISGAASTGVFDLRGTWVGTLTWEISSNGTDFDVTSALQVGGTSAAAQTTATVGQWFANVAGMTQIRVRATAWTSGTANITLRASNAASRMFLNSSLVLGLNGAVLTALTMKAASTAALATDPSLVVALSPNTPLPAGTNTVGSVVATVGTSGGASISRLLSAASTNATSVKASAGNIYGWYLFNANVATRYLKLYNKASAPTVGTDTPVMTIPIPSGAGANVWFDGGISFATGIAFALTTGIADSDTGAVAANDIVVNLLYA